MLKAVANGPRRVHLSLGTVHRLEESMREGEIHDIVRIESGLRVDELQLVTLGQHEVCAGFWAHAHPIETLRCSNRSVRLHGDTESLVVQRSNRSIVELEQ